MTATIRALIADDEKPLRMHLKKLLASAWPELQVCAEADNGIEALKALYTHQPDIAFLDIRMPGMDGMEVARKAADLCALVFITAYDQYAVEAFDQEAVDYLLKPVEPDRLAETIRRLKQRLGHHPPDPAPVYAALQRLEKRLDDRAEVEKYLKWIKVMSHDEIRLIPVEEVSYFQAQDKYTVVQTATEEHLIKKTITSLEQELDPQQFWRIHRSTIVNSRQIAKVSFSFTGGLLISLKGLAGRMPVSRRYQHRFKAM